MLVHCKVQGFYIEECQYHDPLRQCPDGDDKSHGSQKPVSQPEEDRVAARVGAMLYFLWLRQSDHWVLFSSPKLVSACHLDSDHLSLSLSSLAIFFQHGEKYKVLC